MPAVAFAVEKVSDHKMIIRLPGIGANHQRVIQQLNDFLARERSPSVRLDRRDELIRKIAESFYTGSKRVVASALLADAKRYAATEWLLHKGLGRCPEDIEGSL